MEVLKQDTRLRFYTLWSRESRPGNMGDDPMIDPFGKLPDLLHLLENMFDRKRIYANPIPKHNPNSKLNKAQ